MLFVFFFKQKSADEMRISDWSSDVCSSDLGFESQLPEIARARRCAQRGKLAVLADRLAGIARRDAHAGQQQRGGNPQLRSALLDAFGGDLQVEVARLRTGLQTRRSEEHTSELQSLMRNSYAVFCLKKK